MLTGHILHEKQGHSPAVSQSFAGTETVVGVFSGALSSIKGHMDEPDWRHLIQAVQNSFDEPTRSNLLEAFGNFREKNANKSSRWEIEQEIKEKTRQPNKVRLGSLFHVLQEHGVKLSLKDRAILSAAAIGGFTGQTTRAPCNDAERLAQRLTKIEEAARLSEYARDAADLYASADADPGLHPYAVAKRITPYDVKADAHFLFMPLWDSSLVQVGHQRIPKPTATIQTKKTSAGTKLPGHFGFVGALEPHGNSEVVPLMFPELILVAEGWATACALYEATGIPCVITGGCGNLDRTLVTIAGGGGWECCFEYVKKVLVCGAVGQGGVEEARRLAFLHGGLLTGAVFPESDKLNFDFADVLKQHEARADALAEIRVRVIAAAETIGEPEAPKKSDDELIKELAALKPLDYDRVRAEKAGELRVQLKTLDALVKAERLTETEAKRLPFDEIEPYPEPVDPAKLLDDIVEIVTRYIVLDPEQADAAALWVAHSWFISVLELSPLAIINAPEKSCGKSQMLTVLGRMAHRPLPAANASPSALFRAVDAWKPTILIDEADTFFRDNFELQGMVNAGYSRDGFVLRSEAVGDNFEPRVFPVFSPKAIAGVTLERCLPDTTMSRGVVFNLRRKLPNETVGRLRHSDRQSFAEISAKLARFAEDYSEQVRDARPALPDALSDRGQDNWEPLLAVASCASGAWEGRATAAALRLSGIDDDRQKLSNQLLGSIRDVFEGCMNTHLETKELIKALCEDEEDQWAAYRNERPITARQLSGLLEGYKIKSKQYWAAGRKLRGFELSDFDDTFARYLREV